MREKKHERKYRGTSRGMGRDVKKSHSGAGKSQKPFSLGNGNKKRPFCGRPQNVFRPKAREHGKRQGVETRQPGRTGKNTNGSEFSDGLKKYRPKLEREPTNQRNEEKSYQKRGKQDEHPHVFSQRERANGARAKKKRHAGEHDARQAIGHSV